MNTSAHHAPSEQVNLPSTDETISLPQLPVHVDRPRITSKQKEAFCKNVRELLLHSDNYKTSLLVDIALYQYLQKNESWIVGMFSEQRFFEGIVATPNQKREIVLQSINSLVRELRTYLNAEGISKREVNTRNNSSFTNDEAEAIDIENSSTELDANAFQNYSIQADQDNLSEPEVSSLDQRTNDSLEEREQLATPQINERFNRDFLNSSIYDLEVPQRVRVILDSVEQIKTIGLLLDLSNRELLVKSGVGPGTIKAIKEALVKIHTPLGALFDTVQVLPISEKSKITLQEIFNDPETRCYWLLKLDPQTLINKGINKLDIEKIVQYFRENGF